MLRHRLGGWLLGLALLAAPASACDLCSLFTNFDTQETQPGWYAGLSEQYSDFSTLRDDGDKVANPGDESVSSSISQVLAGYQFNRRWGVQLNVPLIDRSFHRLEGENLSSGSESGLGDVSAVVHWRAFERFGEGTTYALSLLGGVKLPTGDSDRLAEELEEDHAGAHEAEHASGVHGHDLALGSGSVDGILGSSGFVGRGRFFVAFELQYALRREGDFQYRYANDLSWSLSPSWFVWLQHGRALSLGVEAFGEKKGQDELDGVKAEDTGLDAVYLGPSLTYSQGGRFYGQLAVDFPVRQKTTALQIVPDTRARLGGTWRF
ncbi:MAG: hypothetical protein U0002_21405 [Thermoanaerobaculia bacterium]